jgi:hypothetical protein
VTFTRCDLFCGAKVWRTLLPNDRADGTDEIKRQTRVHQDQCNKYQTTDGCNCSVILCRSFYETSTQQDRDTSGLTRFLQSLWDDSKKRFQLMARTVSLRLPDVTEAALPTLLEFLRRKRCLLYALVLESGWVGQNGWDERMIVK